MFKENTEISAKDNSLKINELLTCLGISKIHAGATTGTHWFEATGDITASISPINGEKISDVRNASPDDYEKLIKTAQEAFKIWKKVPAPKRGEIVRQIGIALRNSKKDLGKLVTVETGKILQEGLGEVQEMIDICDFAVGQSRLLNGFTMHSERENHRLYDQYHPLGLVGIISSFNFPVAVWAWNTMLAVVAGNVVIWKPSSKTPVTAIAVMKIIQNVLTDNNIPEGVFNLVIAKSSVLGDNFVKDKRIPLFSVTGSTAIGKRIGKIVGERLGKTILELGGNNAVIVSEHADLDMAIPSIVFGAVGTTGQRCTSTRRVIVQETRYEEVKTSLINAYKEVSKRIGNPLNNKILVGPIIDRNSVSSFKFAVNKVQEEGGKILFGGEIIKDNYVIPCIAEAENNFEIVQEETFAPILYLIKYKTFNEAIELNNKVPQGLSSSLFSLNMREIEQFTSESGSDCGIANINTGTSGAEIGGAFGGEKDTGGGRESGSDAWKSYMRRQTNTINYSNKLPLAQGIKFNF